MPLSGQTSIFGIPKEANNTGIADARTFNAAMDYIDGLLAAGIGTWKPPVDTFGDLAGLDPTGTARVVKGENRIYIWSGSAWVPSNEGALVYVGVWDATNPPAGGNPVLSDATGTKGHYYVVSNSGVQDLGSGPIDFNPGDFVIHNGTIWQKADHTDVVTSVFSRQGAVVALAGDYDASQVDDDSLWATASVKVALDALFAHAPRHEGGADPITPAGIGAEPLISPKNTAFNKDFGVLVGTVCQGNDARLSDARTPLDHGNEAHTPDFEPAFAKNTAFNKNFGVALGDVCQGNDARLSDARTPLAHRDSHILAGADAFLATDLLDALVRRVRESGGPTDLLVGAVPDLSFLVRVGTNIIGAPRTALRSWGVTPGDNTGPGAGTGSQTPTVLRYKSFPGTSAFGTPLTLAVLAASSSGNTGFVDIYNEDTGQVMMTVSGIVSTAAGGAIYTTTTIVNPFPAGPARFSIRAYRGGSAAAISLYDLKLT